MERSSAVSCATWRRIVLRLILPMLWIESMGRFAHCDVALKCHLESTRCRSLQTRHVACLACAHHQITGHRKLMPCMLYTTTDADTLACAADSSALPRCALDRRHCTASSARELSDSAEPPTASAAILAESSYPWPHRGVRGRAHCLTGGWASAKSTPAVTTRSSFERRIWRQAVGTRPHTHTGCTKASQSATSWQRYLSTMQHA
jgi:hypothetical protein